MDKRLTAYLILGPNALFGVFFFITQFSSLITLNTTPVWHHHSISITQYFSHYLWAPYLSLIAGFFFCQYPNSPNLVKKKKKKKNEKKRNPGQAEVKERRRRKKKKKNQTANQEKKRRKKKSKVVKSCGWVLFMGPLYVFNYNIAIEV